MKERAAAFSRIFGCVLLSAVILYGAAKSSAQSKGSERLFPQSKATIEKILKQMQPATAGHLPALEGFATAPSADRPLDHYQRGYYQSRFQVIATPSGGCVVRVSVQVTAWYTDPVAAKSGYQVLTSNGRLEADLLDQLADQLAASAPQDANHPVAGTPKPPTNPAASEPTISAPMPRLPEAKGNSSSSLAQSLAAQEQSSSKAESKTVPDKNAGPLQAEADSLEEILKNQAHPKNLVAVKKSGTPVVASASLTAKTLFLASVHDEFEMLDFNRDWVHVRISGLSRGWIWRNNLEMPDSIPDSDAPPRASAVPTAGELFHISREEIAPFPGDWAPLRGKNVKIVSVEKTDENAKDSGPQVRLEFAKSVLEKDYSELAQKPQELAGIVLIFDSADGGMIAATFLTLQQWKAGTLSDAALWHQCFFDPPEILSSPQAPTGE